jgi:hypothetical protein
MAEPAREDHEEFVKKAPRRFLVAVAKAIIPALIVDVGGTLAVYYLLLPHFSSTSLWPLILASMVPVLSNVYDVTKHRKIDVVGILVLLGIAGSIIGVSFGGTQKLLLIRESFITGLVGIALLVSLAFRKPLGYYLVYEFMTANEKLNPVPFEQLWASRYFRWAIRRGTFLWGLLLIGEFVLRVFLVYTLPVGMVLGVGPLIFNFLLLAAGTISAFGMSRTIRIALKPRAGTRS